jgi:tetratricopeptide (TPR) repeat protein
MFMGKLTRVVAVVLMMLAFAATARAENEGQELLDQATDLKLEAETLGDLEKVASLCEEALEKGLDKENARFANQLLSSVLLQHSQRISSAIFDQVPPDRRWQLIRQTATRNLQRAVKADPKLLDAHLLIVKLHVLPGGDEKLAQKSADEAVTIAGDDKEQLARALVLRGQLSDDPEKQLADFAKALEANPRSAEALQARAAHYLAKEDNEQAVADLLKLLELDANNPAVQSLVAETLANLEKFDEALEHINKVIATNPELGLGYVLRARIYTLQEKDDEALDDLNKALKINPEDVMSLLLRSRILAVKDKFEEARADVNKALEIRPDLTPAILMRSMIAAQSKRYGEAIADLRMLLQSDPQNPEWRLQLALFYAADSRPRKAIETLGQLIDDDEDNWQARRARADALLSIGEHSKAIKDYEAALKAQPEDSHMLNNLAWVLATSTEEEVRDAERSIELGTKACEVTDYKAPHILSTLAAGYAEKGDWDTAIKWSSKAVELSEKDEGDVSEQLKQELESYQQKKPWREKQEVEENTKPLDARPDDLEA